MSKRTLIALALFIGGMLAVSHSSPSTAQSDDERHPIDVVSVDQLTPLAWLGTGPVFNVAWSPYNDRLAISNNAGVWLYDSISLQPRGRLPIGADLSVWSPYGSRLATTHDEVIRIWEPFTGELRAVLEGHTRRINSMAWSPDGTKLASANGSLVLIDGEPGSIRIWDAETHELLTLIEADSTNPEFDASSVVWSPDSRFVAALTNDGTVTAWDAETGEQALIFDLDSDFRVNLEWSPDGRYFAVGGGNGQINIYDGFTGEKVVELPEQDEPTWDLSFSPDGTILASGHREGVVIFWDVATWTMTQRVNHNRDDVLTISFSGEGSQLAAAGSDDLVRILDVETGQQVEILQAHGGAAWKGTVSADSQVIFSSGINHRLDAWDTQTWQYDTLIHQTEFISQIVPSTDGEWLAISSRGFFADGRTIRAGLMLLSTDGENTHLLHEVDSPLDIGQGIVFSPNGDYLAAVIEDEVWVWSVQTFELMFTFPTTNSLIENGLYWSPDSTQLALTSRTFRSSAAALWVWDVLTGEVTVELVHDHSVNAVGWSYDGPKLATVYVSGDVLEQTDQAVESIQIWDVDEASQGELLLGHTDEVRLLTWAPDSLRLASGSYDNTVRVWNPRSGEPIYRFTVWDRVRDVQWSPRGDVIFIQSLASDIWFYDTLSGAYLDMLQFEESGDFLWSSDGRFLLENIGGTVRVWGIPSEQDCVITSARLVNRRWWMEVGTEAVGTLDVGQRLVATGQALDYQGITWWQLADLSWVRSDVVNATENCDALPTVVDG